MGEWSYSYTLS